MKKAIGIDISPPKKKCEDKNCPWHGKIAIRGRVFRAIVKNAKSHNTATVEWDFHKYIKKYERYERRKSRMVVHNPECIRAKEGEKVIIGECRPLSKTKKFVIMGVIK